MFEFSQLEFSIKYAVSEAAGIKDKHFDAIMVYDFALLCTIAVQVLGEPWDEAKKQELNRIIAKCRSLNDERVRVAHGLWVPFRDGGVVHHVPRSLKAVRLVGQASHLEKQASETNDCRAKFERLVVNAVL